MTVAFDRARADALRLLDDAVDELAGHDAAAADTVAAARKHLVEGRVAVAVVGEFKRGKSTLLGALVEEPELFPSDVGIATNLVTSAEYGTPESITVYRGDPTAAEPEEITRGEIADFVTEGGNPGNERAAHLLRIRTPSARLRDGLVVLDTPGVGGLNPRHTAVTYAVLGSADVVLFVIDALTPLTREELDLLDRIAGLGARLVVAVTKIDIVVEYESVVTDTRSKLGARLGPEAAAVTPVVPVSALAKIDWLDTGDEESLEVSNFVELEETLDALLARGGGGLLVNRSLAVLARQLDGLLDPLDSELTALTASADEISAQAAELESERARLGTLVAPSAGWRGALASAIEDVRAAAETDLLARLDEIGTRLDERLATLDLATRGEAVLAAVEGDVTLAWITVARRLDVEVARIGDELERLTGLRVNPVLPEGGSLTAFTTFGGHRADVGARAPWLDVVSGLAGFVTFLFDQSGSAVWIVRGLTAMVRRTAAARERRDSFAASARDQLTRATRELRDRLSEVIDSAHGSIRAQYEQLIDEHTTRVAAASDALDAADAGGTASDARRAAQVGDRIAALRGLRERAGGVVQPAGRRAAPEAV